MQIVSKINLMLSQITNDTGLLHASYNNAWPFKHLVIDNFLDAQFAEDVLKAFPSPKDMDIHGGNKKVLTGWQSNPLSSNYKAKHALDELFYDLRSIRLRDFIRVISGIGSELLSDPDYYGSGLLMAPAGGIHEIHLDRNYHPKVHFVPRIIMTMYFNKNWNPEFGGGLQLWNKKITKYVSVAPVFNRCVLFEVSPLSYHSIEKVNFPPGEYRRALNYYFFSDEVPHGYNSSLIHDTIFFSRPEDRLRYWTNNITSNFPFQLISNLTSRSKTLTAVKEMAKSSLGLETKVRRPKSSADDVLQRWLNFNSFP